MQSLSYQVPNVVTVVSVKVKELAQMAFAKVIVVVKPGQHALSMMQ